MAASIGIVAGTFYWCGDAASSPGRPPFATCKDVSQFRQEKLAWRRRHRQLFSTMVQTGERVLLYIYDLSRGMARSLSQHLIGRQIDGIWHTSVVCFGYEIYYGQGIFVTDRVGKTQYGQPMEIKDMGITEIPQEVFATPARSDFKSCSLSISTVFVTFIQPTNIICSTIIATHSQMMSVRYWLLILLSKRPVSGWQNHPGEYQQPSRRFPKHSIRTNTTAPHRRSIRWATSTSTHANRRTCSSYIKSGTPSAQSRSANNRARIQLHHHNV